MISTSSREILALSQVHLVSISRVYYFLDASRHLYTRVCPSIRWCVHPSVHPLVRPSIRPSVRPFVHPLVRRSRGFFIAEMGQKCSENIMQLTQLNSCCKCHSMSFIHSLFIHSFIHSFMHSDASNLFVGT